MIGAKNKSLKEFYVRALRLLISSETLTEFGCNLEVLLTITLCETNGWTDDDEFNKTPSEKSREMLLNKIKGLPEESNFTDNFQNTDDLQSTDDIDDINYECTNNLSNYLDSIYDRSQKNSSVTGNRLSAYYFPDLTQQILRICKEFPL